VNDFLNERPPGSGVSLVTIGQLLIYILLLKEDLYVQRPPGSTLLLICFLNLSKLFRPTNEFVLSNAPAVSRQSRASGAERVLQPGPPAQNSRTELRSFLKRPFPAWTRGEEPDVRTFA
jgi:hypothetical protein